MAGRTLLELVEEGERVLDSDEGWWKEVERLVDSVQC